MHANFTRTYRSLSNLALLATLTSLTSGCAHLYHTINYNPLAELVHEHHRSYYHSPKTGRIIPKEHHNVCPVEPPCFGYEPTCWHRWPIECEKCPVQGEVLVDMPVSGQVISEEVIQQGMPQSPSVAPPMSEDSVVPQSVLPEDAGSAYRAEPMEADPYGYSVHDADVPGTIAPLEQSPAIQLDQADPIDDLQDVAPSPRLEQEAGGFPDVSPQRNSRPTAIQSDSGMMSSRRERSYQDQLMRIPTTTPATGTVQDTLTQVRRAESEPLAAVAVPVVRDELPSTDVTVLDAVDELPSLDEVEEMISDQVLASVVPVVPVQSGSAAVDQEPAPQPETEQSVAAEAPAAEQELPKAPKADDTEKAFVDSQEARSATDENTWKNTATPQGVEAEATPPSEQVTREMLSTQDTPVAQPTAAKTAIADPTAPPTVAATAIPSFQIKPVLPPPRAATADMDSPLQLQTSSDATATIRFVSERPVVTEDRPADAAKKPSLRFRR